MSSALDYWPFDYDQYTQHILPAIVQMLKGETGPLQMLIKQAKVENLPLFMPWGRPSMDIYEPICFSSPDWSTFERQILEPGNISFGVQCEWTMLLHLYLIYTFCCAKPLESTGAFRLRGDESVYAWKRFAESDEDGRQLWNLFYASPNADLCRDILYLPLDKDHPRALDPFVDYGMHGTPMGFITPKETQVLHIYMQKHTHKSPFLTFLVQPLEKAYVNWVIQQLEQECGIRGFYWGEHEQQGLKIIPYSLEGITYNKASYHDKYINTYGVEYFTYRIDKGEKVYISPLASYERIIPPFSDYAQSPLFEKYVQENPQEVAEIQQRELDRLWEQEDDLLTRLDYAVAHGWGMLLCYASGG